MAGVPQRKFDKYPETIKELLQECSAEPQYEELNKVYPLMEYVLQISPSDNLQDKLDSFNLDNLCAMRWEDQRCFRFFETWMLTAHSQSILIGQAIEIGPAQEIFWIKFNTLVTVVEFATQFATPERNRRLRVNWIRAVLNRMREPLTATLGKETFADNVKAFGRFFLAIIKPLLGEVSETLDEDLMLRIMENLGKGLPINVILESEKILMGFGEQPDSAEGVPLKNTEGLAPIKEEPSETNIHAYKERLLRKGHLRKALSNEAMNFVKMVI